MDALLSVNTMQEWELVAVDNGSEDGTDAYLASIDKKRSDRASVKGDKLQMIANCRGMYPRRCMRFSNLIPRFSY